MRAAIDVGERAERTYPNERRDAVVSEVDPGFRRAKSVVLPGCRRILCPENVAGIRNDIDVTGAATVDYRSCITEKIAGQHRVGMVIKYGVAGWGRDDETGIFNTDDVFGRIELPGYDGKDGFCLLGIIYVKWIDAMGIPAFDGQGEEKPVGAQIVANMQIGKSGRS